MELAFYVAASVALLASILVITQTHAVHALLYLVVSLLGVAVTFYVLGAPFAAALEIIVYAGAIMVLFVFVIMMLNLGPHSRQQEEHWLPPGIWFGPVVLSAILLAQMVYLLLRGGSGTSAIATVGAEEVGMTLFGPYLLAVELASLLLLAALVAAHHLGQDATDGEAYGSRSH